MTFILLATPVTNKKYLAAMATQAITHIKMMCIKPLLTPPSILESLGFQPLTNSEVEGVERFVVFMGYPRSGHSFLTSVLDAHPNIVISINYYLHQKCTAARHKSGGNLFRDKLSLFNDLYKTSYVSAKCGLRSDIKARKGYNLNIEGQLQGSFRQLRIIGDGAVNLMKDKNNEMETCVKQMIDTLDMAVTGIHVVRNPFDMIATAMLYELSSVEGTKVQQTKVQPNMHIQMKSANKIFRYASIVVQLKKIRNFKVLDIHIEEFIKDTKTSINKLCSGLDIPCSQEYIESCYEKSYKNVVRTRDRIEWNPDVIEYISEQMTNYSFFQGYTFQNDYYTPSN